MAIFYNHIKGCGVNTTGMIETLGETGTNTGNTNESWGWITWPSQLKYTKNATTNEGNADFRYVSNCPELRFNNINSKPADSLSSLSLGKFIFSDAREQTINEHFRFNNAVDIYDSDKTTSILMTSNKNGSSPIITMHQDCWVTSGKSLMFSDTDYSYSRYAHIYWQKSTFLDWLYFIFVIKWR